MSLSLQDEVPLFHFEGLLMHDKDAGERWEVRG